MSFDLSEPLFVRVARLIVRTRQYEHVHRLTGEIAVEGMPGAVLFDLFSAHAVCTVWDNLSERNRERYATVPAERAIYVAIELVSVDKESEVA